jgi:hypothetical protein
LPQKLNFDNEGSKEEKKVYGPTMPASVEVSKKRYGPSLPSSVEVPKKQYGPAMPSRELSLSPERLPAGTAAEKSARNRSRSPPSRESWMTEVGQQGQLKMGKIVLRKERLID